VRAGSRGPARTLTRRKRTGAIYQTISPRDHAHLARSHQNRSRTQVIRARPTPHAPHAAPRSRHPASGLGVAALSTAATPGRDASRHRSRTCNSRPRPRRPAH
jgi:hypothetical protein